MATVMKAPLDARSVAVAQWRVSVAVKVEVDKAAQSVETVRVVLAAE